jgi:hypothetical protein
MLLREWREGLETAFRAARDESPAVYARCFRTAAREWAAVLDRFASAFDGTDELALLGAMDEYVAWMRFNRDRFREQVRIWDQAAAVAHQQGEERRMPDGSYRIEDFDFSLWGDVRDPLTKLFVMGADLILEVVLSAEVVFGEIAEVPDELWEEAHLLSPGHAMSFFSTRPPRPVRLRRRP